MTVYVLWKDQKDNLGIHAKVTTNEHKKEYPRNNLYFHGQYNTLKELRKKARGTGIPTECKECGKKIDTETRIYLTIPPACKNCYLKHKTAGAL